MNNSKDVVLKFRGGKTTNGFKKAIEVDGQKIKTVRVDLTAKQIQAILNALRNWDDVLLGGCIKIAHGVDAGGKPYNIAQMLNVKGETNLFRDANSDDPIRFSRSGKAVTKTDYVEELKEKKSYRSSIIHVTPDFVVTCPQCGTNFRVGKKLI